jgi:AraC-like DNA-binding protein
MPESAEIMPESTDTPAAPLLEMLEKTLRFEYYGGGLTPLRQPQTTGWRTMPFALISQNPHGRSRLDLVDSSHENGVARRACCVRAGIRHCCTLISKESLSRWVHVRFVVLGGIDLFALINPPLFIEGDQGLRIGDINEKLVHHMNRSPHTFQDALRRNELGLELLQAVFAGVDISASAEGFRRAQRILPALEYIHQNLHRPVMLPDLAKRVHLSPSRFHAVFRGDLGISPRDYIQRHRVQKSQELLITTSMNLAEIAESVGYASQFNFSRIFKKSCGVSPSRYRAEVRASEFGSTRGA